MRLSVILKPRDPESLESFATNVSTPGSSRYHRFLAPGQFATVFGPLPSTIRSVLSTLRQRGLRPGLPSSNGLDIPVVTTVAGAESAFSVSIDALRLPDGRSAYANTVAPTLPGSVSGYVQTILGLDDLVQVAPIGGVLTPNQLPSDSKSETSASPAASSGSGPVPCAAGVYGAATASDLASAYDFDGLYAEGDLGANITVGLVELSSYSDTDISTYESCYSINPKITNIAVDGGASLDDPAETEGDIEDVIGLAPDVNLLVYEAPDSETGEIDLINEMVSADKAQVFSTSFGAYCESQLSTSTFMALNVVFEQAAAQGETFFGAAGDSGSECNYLYTGSTALGVDSDSLPFITGVGGTMISSYGPPPSEAVWNEIDIYTRQRYGGGGGISSVFPMPSWQAGPGVLNSYSSGAPCGDTTGDCREVPDVSALAGSPYYAFYFEGYWEYFYGTSFATPLWAALLALSDSACSGTSAGFINPVLYQLATAGKGDFNDITTGNNDVSGTSGGVYPATSGYDMASGLGTPKGTQLAADLCSFRITTTVLPSAKRGSAYTAQLQVVGGVAPYTWKLIGTLPKGLKLNKTTGVLAGKPSSKASAMTYTFTVQVTDNSKPKKTATQTLSLVLS